MADQIVEPGRVAGPAGFASRGAALVLDAFLIAIAQLTVGYAVTTVLSVLLPGTSVGVRVTEVAPVVTGAVIIVSYFIFCWTAFGRTMGMGLMGLKMVTLEGKDVRVWRAVVRYVGFVLSVVCLGLGLLWVLIDNRRMGWHDHLARTQVLRVRRRIGNPVHHVGADLPSTR
jgi:uncharacterized RDD family membrane protein YckC